MHPRSIPSGTAPQPAARSRTSLTMHRLLPLALLVSCAAAGNAPLAAQEKGIHANYTTRKKARDRALRGMSDGVLDMKKIRFLSRNSNFEVPAYVFQPLEKRGPAGHPALIWIHGGVHGDLSTNYWPFIRQACDRGYVVICPEYRGSTGYGKSHYDAIDYGGKEVDDCSTCVDWLRANTPHVDTNRIGLVGFSHGGFITLHGAFREPKRFRAAVAIVPVTNLIFRLAQKGPMYQRSYVKQPGIGGLPHEKREIYMRRSPIYHVDKLRTPLLVHVTRNDEDVTFAETEMLIHALKVKKPSLAETRIYDAPKGGHMFNRLVDPKDPKLPERTPELRDSWNRIWTFLEWNLRPYEKGPRK